jgi:hypothetical protein
MPHRAVIKPVTSTTLQETPSVSRTLEPKMQPASEAPPLDSDSKEQYESYSDYVPESDSEEEETDPTARPKLYVAVFAEDCRGCRILYCQNFTSKWRAVRKLLEFIYRDFRYPKLSYADLVTHFTSEVRTSDDYDHVADEASVKAALETHMEHLAESNASLSDIRRQLNTHFPERQDHRDHVYGVKLAKIKTDESVDELDGNILL